MLYWNSEKTEKRNGCLGKERFFLLFLCSLFLSCFSCEEGLARMARVSSRRRIEGQFDCVSAMAAAGVEGRQGGDVGKLYEGEYIKNVSFRE